MFGHKIEKIVCKQTLIFGNGFWRHFTIPHLFWNKTNYWQNICIQFNITMLIGGIWFNIVAVIKSIHHNLCITQTFVDSSMEAEYIPPCCLRVARPAVVFKVFDHWISIELGSCDPKMASLYVVYNCLERSSLCNLNDLKVNSM